MPITDTSGNRAADYVFTVASGDFGGWTFLLSNIADGSTLLDLTSYATAKVSVRLNRPLGQTLNLSVDTPGLHTIAGDGDPNLVAGTRSIKAYQDGVLRANTKIQALDYVGDADSRSVQIAAYDPLLQLLSRTVFDASGRLADPIGLAPSPTTAASLIQFVIANSVLYEDNVGSPAPLPIDYTSGTLTGSTDIACELTDSPMTIGDLIGLLTDTGVADIEMVPIEGSAGLLARMNVVEEQGSDLSATVHFDYATGDFSCSGARRGFDIGELCNRLTYELGPKTGLDQWQGNIVGTETTPVDLSAYQALQLASRAKYGTYATVRIYDSGTENAARPLFHRLWKTEVILRHAPREMLFLTPAAGDGCPFRPFIDYNAGDIVTTNVEGLGPSIADAQQRIYGFDVDIGLNGVENVGELLTSADAE